MRCTSVTSVDGETWRWPDGSVAKPEDILEDNAGADALLAAFIAGCIAGVTWLACKAFGGTF